MEFQDAGMDGRKGWIDLLRGSLCNHLESFPLWIQDTRTFFPGVDSISYKTLQLMRPVLVLWSIVSPETARQARGTGVGFAWLPSLLLHRPPTMETSAPHGSDTQTWSS